MPVVLSDIHCIFVRKYMVWVDIARMTKFGYVRYFACSYGIYWYIQF